MNTFTTHSRNSADPAQRGFTLIELMVAITLGIFLIGGLLMMVQSTRDAFGKQQLLAQLQDNERLVMTFMADVVESAGYFPNPVLNLNTTIFPGLFVIPHGGQQFVTPGQAVYGTSNAVAPGDTVTIRYAAAPNDNVFNCRGTINTTGATDVFVNTFWVNAANPNNPVLTCTVSSANGAFATADVPLVNGVQNLTILYGVKRSVADTGSCADTYLKASEMILANDWINVCSINVSISFINPLQPAGLPIVIQRVIATMNAAGVNS
ncbi:MAG TPA: PilW family protein [Steroidobacteraceae bacterium]|jgi:type IV pilus assembly protein PilW|nr:PilW family protein [Steroidobacteraceae bacterium]